MTVSRAPAATAARAGAAALATLGALSLGLPGPVASAAPGGQTGASAASAPPATSAPAAKADAAALRATTAALGDLGLALLREMPGPNAVVSPVAVATILGMVQSGATGATEHEIEALFGAGRTGAQAMRVSLPALSAQLREGAADGKTAPLRQAARVWIDPTVAKAVPLAFKRRLAQRHGADAVVINFAETEATRTQINRWTAEHTAGRVAELLPAGSIGASTQLTLTAAVHFRAAWDKPFDVGQTEPRPFQTTAGGAAPVPTLNDERVVAQAVVDGTQLYALPFAAAYDLVLALPAVSAVPAAGGGVEAMLKGLTGATFANWQTALKSPPARCNFALPKFSFAPKAGSIKAPLERLGVKTAFTEKAELRPMLGRSAPGSHVDDVHHAAGIAIDEQGGEAVAASAATVKPKTLAAPPACAVDRAFAFVVMHRASGVPVFVGRVGDPARSE
jgi:serpin B